MKNKKKTDKVKILSLTEISEVLNEQQEVVGIIGKYIQPILIESTDRHADLAMQHIFLNIRNSYQDGIFISQGLINNRQYYMSPALAHAQRAAQEFLIDLAYIMRDIKNKKGNKYDRYLKFILTMESEELKRQGTDNTDIENLIKKIFPPDLELPKRGGQWTDTSRKDKIEQGLKFYKIEPDHFADFRFDFHSDLSSTAHGNADTISAFTRTPEENLPKLKANLTVSTAHFEVVLESALICYIQLYLGRNKDCEEIINSMFPAKRGYKRRARGK